jgi:hypothetical protein
MALKQVTPTIDSKQGMVSKIQENTVWLGLGTSLGSDIHWEALEHIHHG